MRYRILTYKIIIKKKTLFKNINNNGKKRFILTNFYIHFFTFFKYPKIFGDVYSFSIISQIFYKDTGNLVWRILQLEKGIFDARVGYDVGIYKINKNKRAYIIGATMRSAS